MPTNFLKPEFISSFTTSGTTSPTITFTNASTGSWWDQIGNAWVVVDPNEPIQPMKFTIDNPINIKVNLDFRDLEIENFKKAITKAITKATKATKETAEVAKKMADSLSVTNVLAEQCFCPGMCDRHEDQGIDDPAI